MLLKLRTFLAKVRDNWLKFWRSKWHDKASFLVFAFSMPWILFKTTVLIVPTTLYTFAVWMHWHRAAYYIERPLYWVANGLNDFEWYPVMAFSYLLNWREARVNYQANRSVIEYLESVAPSGESKRVVRGQLSYNMVNAAKKEGWWEVWAKFLSMFTFLPTYRHAFLNNPLLFKYRLLFTNQMTSPIPEREQLPQVIFSYVGNPEFLQALETECGQWKMDDLGFTPNYFNNLDDTVIDHNNMGLQVAAFHTTNIYLDTVIKTPEALQQQLSQVAEEIEQSKANQSQAGGGTVVTQAPLTLGQIGHHRYEEARMAGIPVTFLRELDSRHRVPFLSLTVPYQSHYHVMTGVVEANVVQDTKGHVVEHPMLCLYHDGVQMEYLWGSINNLFDNFVMGYLSHMGLSGNCDHSPMRMSHSEPEPAQ